MTDAHDGNMLPLYKEIHELEPPDLIKNNKWKVAPFEVFGLFLVYWNKKAGIYEASQKKLLLYYLLWYVIPIIWFGLAYALKEYFKSADYMDKVDDLIEACFIGIVLGIIPAFWIYLLREYSTNLPQILKDTSDLESIDMYKKLELCVKNNSKISYKEGWAEDENNDENDEETEETKKIVDDQYRLVKYGPYVGFGLSFLICVILIIVSFFWDISVLILETPASSIKHLKKELPFFIMSILYPIPYIVSIWFCIFFLEWQRKIYESVRLRIRIIKKSIETQVADNTENGKIVNEDNTKEVEVSGTILTEKTKKEIKSVGCLLKKVQKIFILLNKKIFQKTIVVNFVLFIFISIFCCWKVLQDPSNFAYIVPLTIVIGHMYFACSWSNALMKEFNETNEVLNEMLEEELPDVQELYNKFNKYPPQVLAFGGFNVNYKMMTAALAFIISCISIPEEMWPEDKQHCYRYDDGTGEWNQTFCIRNKIIIKFNESITIKNLVN